MDHFAGKKAELLDGCFFLPSTRSASLSNATGVPGRQFLFSLLFDFAILLQRSKASAARLFFFGKTNPLVRCGFRTTAPGPGGEERGQFAAAAAHGGSLRLQRRGLRGAADPQRAAHRAPEAAVGRWGSVGFGGVRWGSVGFGGVRWVGGSGPIRLQKGF